MPRTLTQKLIHEQRRHCPPGRPDADPGPTGTLGMLELEATGLDYRGEPSCRRSTAITTSCRETTEPGSARDAILELLKRHGVDGGRGRILEYFGPGLAPQSTMERHVLANMGTELGATSSVFRPTRGSVAKPT